MKKKVYAYLHTHWDREWYREFEEFRLRLVEVFDDVLEKLKNSEIPSFYFDGQTAALEDYLEIRPQNTELIKKYIREKKLFIGPYYCSTDSFLVDTESIIKNLQLGIEYSKHFGCKDFIAYHADTFGHSKYIPEIIKYFEIKNAFFWRGLGELNSEFLFNGLKSTYLIEGYFHDYFSANTTYEKKAEMLKRTLDRISKYSSNEILLPLGADHLALPPDIKKQVKEINKILENYEIILTTPFEYIKRVESNYKKTVKDEFRDTKRNFILPGVLSSRIDLKQKNAKLQWQISRVIQPLQAILSIANTTKNYQQSVDHLYKKLIQNHPHDSIYGCSTDNVHKTNNARYQEVQEGLNAILNSIKRDLYKENCYSVINLSNYDYNGSLKLTTTNELPKELNAQLINKTKGFPLTKLYKINETPITEDYTYVYEYLVDVNKINKLSVKNINSKDIYAKSTLKISKNSLENSNIKLSINRGCIEITDKKAQKTYTNFIKIIDRGDIGDSYNFGALKNDKPIISKIISSKIKEKGHIRSILEITFEIEIPTKTNKNGRSKTIKKHQIKVDAILENQNKYIEFVANWNNKSTNHILQIEFNIENPINETTSDDLCGFVKRNFDPNYDIYKNIPAPRGIELKHNTAPIQKSLFTQGIGLITEGLQEYEVFKNKLRLTILRATGRISTPQNPTRGTPAGPPLPTPDLQMLGKNTARFALSFVNSIKDLQPDVEKFYETTLLIEGYTKNFNIFEVENKNIIISTIKTNNENGLIIRVLNKSDKSQNLILKTGINAKKIYELDATEQMKKEFAPTIEANSFKTILIKMK